MVKDIKTSMLKDKGLNKRPYLKSSELVTWMKIASLAGELDATVQETRDKEWHRKLKTAATLIMQVVNERLECLDKKQMASVIRRRQHSSVKLYTSDELRTPKSADEQEHVTLAYNDVLDLADLAVNSCGACAQGDCVKGCHYRQVFHRCSLPVCRDEPKEGECEFSWLKVGETEQLKPRNVGTAKYYEEDFVL